MSKSRRERRLEQRRKEKDAKQRKGLTRREFLKRGLIAVGGLAISGGVISLIYNSLAREPELTLENAKRSSDPEFIQAYLDKILATGKVTFQSTEVVYDPNSRKVIEFWEDQLVRYPEKEEFVRKQIEKEKSRQVEIERFRREIKSGSYTGYIPLANTAVGVDLSTAVFVYEIPFLAETDDDVLWFLEHERCHAEVSKTYNINVTGEFDPEEVKKIIESTLSMYDVEEARYSSI